MSTLRANYQLNDAVNETDVTRDALFSGRLRLAQPARGHRAGTDAVLLAAFAGASDGLILDVGAGVGTIGLALALRNPGARICLLEREPIFAVLARENIAINGVEARANVVETDVLAAFPRRNAGVRNESADLVVTNPPFYDGGVGRPSPNRLKREAHIADDNLDAWLRACLTIVKPGGTVCVIHRAERLGTILAALEGRSGGARLRSVHPRRDAPASRVLVAAIKGSRAPMTIEPPLILHGSGSAFTAEASALHAGDWIDADKARCDQSQTRTNEG